MENLHSIGAPEFGFGGPLRMRHHPAYVAAFAANAGNIIQRSVRMGGRRSLTPRGCIAEHYAVVAMQLIQGRLVAEIVSLHMTDRDRQEFSQRTGIRKRRRSILDAHLHWLADVFQAGVPHESPRQEPGLA